MSGSLLPGKLNRAEGRDCRSFCAENPTPQRQRNETCIPGLLPLPRIPAAFRSHEKRDPLALCSVRSERKDIKQGVATSLIQQIAKSSRLAKHLAKGHEGRYLWRSDAMTLLGCLHGDPLPAFPPLVCCLLQTAFTTDGSEWDNQAGAEFRSLLHEQLKSIEFDECSAKGKVKQIRRLRDLIENSERNHILTEISNLSQKHPSPIGELIPLTLFCAQDLPQMLGFLARDDGLMGINFVYKEPAPGHTMKVRPAWSRAQGPPTMIAHLRGELLEKHPNGAVIACGGVGYALTLPVSTFTALPEPGAEAKVHVYTAVREDAIQLFGFATIDEKQMFEQLITVSGIGPKLAVTILSGIGVKDLAASVLGGDAARLVRIPGVGKKTAERIVLELKDKFQKWGIAAAVAPGVAAVTALKPVEEDVLSALLNLGCARPAAESALLKARDAVGGGDFEKLFRRALELVR